MSRLRGRRGVRAASAIVALILVAGGALWSSTSDPVDAQSDEFGPNGPPTTAATGTEAEPQSGGPSAEAAAHRADAILSIASVSPWVAPDGDFHVQFEPTTRVPADAELTVTLHQSLDPDKGLRSQVQDIVDGASAGGFLRAPMTRPVSDFGDPATGLQLTVPIRSQRADSDRILVPNPGIHPVELVLTSADGPELWSEVVFLNRLPVVDDDKSPPPVRVTLLLPIGSGPAVSADDTGAFSLEERSTLSAVGGLLEDARGVPLTLAPRPNTLDGLALTDEPWARSLLDAIADDGAGHALLALPYVPVSSGGLVASGAADELTRQIDLGRQTIERVARRPASTDTWVFDSTVTAETLPVLTRAGIDSMVVPSGALEVGSRLDEEDISSRPVRLAGSSIRALTFDGEVSGLLAGSPDEPGRRAHEAVTMLMARWFSESTTRNPQGPSSVVLVTSEADARTLAALRPALTGNGPLSAQPGTDLLPAPEPDKDEPVAELAAVAPTNQQPAVRAADDTRRLTDAYRSMVLEGDHDLWAWERVNDQTMSSTIDDGQRLQMHLAVRERINERLAEIELPRPRRVVVTSRETTIPLRFRNDLPFDVHLELRTRSPRLEIGGGESRRIVLAPGENRIDLPVTVQAPGESLLRLQVTSPLPGIQIPGADVPVRSTAISGVGAALSIVSVLFLIGWWIHTNRRQRRNGAKVAGVHPTGRGGTDSLPSGG